MIIYFPDGGNITGVIYVLLSVLTPLMIFFLKKNLF